MKQQKHFLRLFVLVSAGFLLLTASTCRKVTPGTQPIVTNVTELMVDSLRIVLQPSGNEVVSVALFIDGGYSNYPIDKSGLEYMTLKALLQGTGDEAFAEKLRDTHAEFHSDVTRDFAVLGFTCLREEAEDVWNVFAGLVTSPEMNEAATENARAEMLALIYREGSSQEGLTHALMEKHLFAGRQYSKNAVGTTEYIKYLRPADLDEYLGNLLLNRRRMVLAVSGNLDYEIVSDYVMSGLSEVPLKPYSVLADDPVLPLPAGVYMSQLDGRETRITGMVKAPPPGTVEEAALLAALHLAVVRTRDELEAQQIWPSISYASLSHTRWPWAQVVFQGTEAPATAKAIVAQLRSIADDGVSQAEIKWLRHSVHTRMYQGQELAQERAFTLGRDALVHHWDDSFRLSMHLENLTAEDVTAALRRYGPVQTWLVAGDTSAVNRQIFLQPSGQ